MDTETETPTDPDATGDRPLVALVLAGGTGTRLYPASRPGRPKQFCDFGTGESLLSRTVARTGFADETYVLTAPDQAATARDHAPEAAVLAEPAARDTGPALVYAAHRIREQVGPCTLVCLPSDHHVEGPFPEAARSAARVAADTSGLVLLGVEPTAAATGYGYLKPGDDCGGYHAVEKFVEKPSPGAAARYREHGYLWNAGMFAWTPAALLAAARDSPLAPLVEACEAGDPEAGYDAVDPVSIDTAVLERAAGSEDHAVFVVPAAFEWDDLGTWDAMDSLVAPDADGNVHAGAGGSLAIDSENVTLAAGEEAHVTAVDCEGLVVATYDDRTFVVPRRRADRVREVVDALRERGAYEPANGNGSPTGANE
jgi:mannose-1-phosphate guanylyltransferase